jgi:phosphoribosylformimino-5-aminoimidazole carboxamide ribotide isomerase
MIPLIPVIDIQNGIVVHGIAGNRANYLPLKSVWTESTDPLEVAQKLWDLYAPPAVYIADLDAISGKRPNTALYEALIRRDIHFWLDAGPAGLDIPSTRTIHALEWLKEFQAEEDTAIFSLDLRNGFPLRADPRWPEDPLEIAFRAVEAGYRELLLLDLVRVGTGLGLNTEPLAQKLRNKYPALRLMLGGGIRSHEDINRLEPLGLAGVLVASALHDGSIRPRH